MQEIKLNEDETSHFKKINYQHTIKQKKQQQEEECRLLIKAMIQSRH